MAENEWFDDDQLWIDIEPILFNPSRIDLTPEQIDKVTEILQIAPGVSVLDLCCGIGRHSLELARRGFEVTGVDRTKPYLDKAINKAREENLDIRFIQADMIDYADADKFDAVINMYTSFGYFSNPDDDRVVLSNVYRSLKPGGKCLIDMHGKESMARIFTPRSWTRFDDIFLLEERTLQPNWSGVEMKWIIVKSGDVRELNLKLRVYSAVEILTLMYDIGFLHCDIYGDLDGNPYDHKAPRMIVVATK